MSHMRLDILNSLRFWLVELSPGSSSYYHWFIATDKLLSGFCLSITPNLLGLTLRWEYSAIWQVAALIVQHLNKRISACTPWYQACQLRLTVWTIAISTSILPTCTGTVFFTLLDPSTEVLCIGWRTTFPRPVHGLWSCIDRRRPPGW